jgi:hypothetical protein
MLEVNEKNNIKEATFTIPEVKAVSAPNLRLSLKLLELLNFRNMFFFIG